MKKANLAMIIGISAALTLTACGGRQRPDASGLAASREKRAAAMQDADTAGQSAKDSNATGRNAQDADAAERSAKDSDAAGGNAQDAAASEQRAKDGSVAGGKAQDADAAGENARDNQPEPRTGVVFGSPDASGCRDFKYLTEETISTAKNASRRQESFSVYVPKEERERVSGSSARGERAGVYVKVDLEPYLRYKAENYSISSNLDKYVTGEMAYYENYYDVMVGNIEEIQDGAVCEVSYMEYDFYEDSYAPYYAIYSLHNLGDNVMALVTLSIDAEHTTEETKNLLDELSSFYQIEIHWDESFAQAKRESFEDKYTGNIFDVGGLSFKLPDKWVIDEEMSDEYGIVYLPYYGADMEDAYLTVMTPDEAIGMVDILLDSREEMEGFFKEEFEDEQDAIAITDMGMTFLGHTVKMEMLVHEEEEAGNEVMIIAEDDKNLYMIYAFSAFEEGQEEILGGLAEEVQEALDMFWETGRVDDSIM